MKTSQSLSILFLFFVFPVTFLVFLSSCIRNRFVVIHNDFQYIFFYSFFEATVVILKNFQKTLTKKHQLLLGALLNLPL